MTRDSIFLAALITFSLAAGVMASRAAIWSARWYAYRIVRGFE
jgi:hypothetical protein